MSSTISVRLSDELRARLMATARERAGSSLNREIVRLLEDAVFGDALEEFLEDCGFPRFIRIRTSNTHADMRRMKSIIRATKTDQIVLAARQDDWNNAVLVMVITTERRVFVLDTSSMNLARPPREKEVQELLQALDGRGLLETAEFHPELIEDTSEMPVEKAAEIIVKGPGVRPLTDLSEYLHVLSQHGLFEEAEFRADTDDTVATS